MSHNYAARQEANEASRTTAEAHGEIWEAHEIELLEECWSDVDLPEIAETLGRTIEACRQKHYDIANAAERQARTKRAKSSKNSQWDKGWSSLEDMGF
jgi:hypothetical protein